MFRLEFVLHEFHTVRAQPSERNQSQKVLVANALKSSGEYIFFVLSLSLLLHLTVLFGTKVWINSNMRSHESFEKCECQREMEIIELTNQSHSRHSRKVGLVGVLSNEPNLYKPGAFGGAVIEDPWETLAYYKKFLEQENHCDLVVPLCHLYETQDEITCKSFDFPVVLSGHDHHIVDRVVDGTRILKPGSDAHHAIQLDIIWDSIDSQHPRIEATCSLSLKKAVLRRFVEFFLTFAYLAFSWSI